MKPSDYYATPWAVFWEISRLYGPFDIDVCATQETAKCPRFFTEKDNALVQPWEGRCFMNPPYSNVSPWLEKAVAETKRGVTTVALLKHDHSTGWWKKWVEPYGKVHYWPHRIKFDVPPGLVGKDGKPMKAGTPSWCSSIVVF